jgi:DnaJ-domain-containing protein 1
MVLNKEFITRIIVSVFVIFFFLKVVGPFIIAHFKRKIPGYSEPENDIDAMIRRQKERLKAQYGLQSSGTEAVTSKAAHAQRESGDLTVTQINLPQSDNVKSIIQETKWGSSKIIKELQQALKTHYAYTFAESKLSAFFLIVERRKLLSFLSIENQNNNNAIIKYSGSLFIFLIIIDEIKNKKLDLTQSLSKKIKINEHTLALAIQIKILLEIKEKSADLKEQRIFQSDFILHQFSDETIQLAISKILQKEANLWALGPAQFLEELSLCLNQAFFLTPYPTLTKNDDYETCYQILGIDENADEDEIKKTFKKFAMSYHPDKIDALKLPKILDKKAKEKFNSFQRAYEIILKKRKS